MAASFEYILSEARKYLIEHGTDQELVDCLKDMILCSPTKIANELQNSDYEILSEYIYLPRSRTGNINMKGARQELVNLLNNFPAFRSQDASEVCLSIATFYQDNPQLIRTNEKGSPSWARNLPPSPRNSGNATRSPGSPLPQLE